MLRFCCLQIAAAVVAANAIADLQIVASSPKAI
jgi:hypothetical protein